MDNKLDQLRIKIDKIKASKYKKEKRKNHIRLNNNVAKRLFN